MKKLGLLAVALLATAAGYVTAQSAPQSTTGSSGTDNPSEGARRGQRSSTDPQELTGRERSRQNAGGSDKANPAAAGAGAQDSSGTATSGSSGTSGTSGTAGGGASSGAGTVGVPDTRNGRLPNKRADPAGSDAAGNSGTTPATPAAPTPPTR